MSEEREDIVVLVDENGEENEFEYLDAIEINGNEYVILVPYSEEESEEVQDDADEEEIIILKVEHNADGEDTFVSIEDEDELNEVFEEFQARMEEDYDFDDDDEE